MRLDLTPDELLTTTRAVRRRLDFDKPVERDVLLECLDIALQAPSGSNSQRWHWLFVSDADKKKALADLYRQQFGKAYGSISGAGTLDATGTRVWSSANYLAENFEKVPVMMVACQWGRVDHGDTNAQAGFWGSLLPAVWSFMLALRARGLGSAWTTMHLAYEREAADILGIPYEKVTQGGLFPIAYTQGTDFKPGDRKSHESIVHWDTW
ncbi:MAG: nitroreductase family protein [Acidimicrobiia bacterium]